MRHKWSARDRHNNDEFEHDRGRKLNLVLSQEKYVLLSTAGADDTLWLQCATKAIFSWEEILIIS